MAENVGLIVDERAAVKALAEMNVGDVQEFHLLWDLHEMMRPCVMAQGGNRDVSQNRTRGSESRVKGDHPPCGVQGQRPARRRRRLSAEQSSNRKAAATEESRGDHPLWRGSKGQRPLARLTPENAARRRIVSLNKVSNVGSDGLANSRASLKNFNHGSRLNIFQAAATWERDVLPRNNYRRQCRIHGSKEKRKNNVCIQRGYSFNKMQCALCSLGSALE